MTSEDIRRVESGPQRGLAVAYAMSFPITAIIVWGESLAVICFSCVCVLAACITYRRLVWGIIAEEGSVSLHFPAWPWEDRKFMISDVAEIALLTSRFRSSNDRDMASYSDTLLLTFRNGKKLHLSRIGTRQFYDVVAYFENSGVVFRRGVFS
jgi:hypothetical protein